jgi:hypothetical protein
MFVKYKDHLSLQERLKMLGMLTSVTGTSDILPRKHGECVMEDLQLLVVVQCGNNRAKVSTLNIALRSTRIV